MATIAMEPRGWRRVSVGTLTAMALAAAAVGLSTTAILRTGAETPVGERQASVEAPGVEVYARTSSAAVREQGAFVPANLTRGRIADGLRYAGQAVPSASPDVEAIRAANYSFVNPSSSEGPRDIEAIRQANYPFQSNS